MTGQKYAILFFNVWKQTNVLLENMLRKTVIDKYVRGS